MQRVIRPKLSSGSKDGKKRIDKKHISKEGTAATGDQALLLCVTFDHFQILFSTEVICIYAIFPPWDRDQILVSKTTLQQYQALRRYLIGISQIKNDIEIFSILNSVNKGIIICLYKAYIHKESCSFNDAPSPPEASCKDDRPVLVQAKFIIIIKPSCHFSIMP